MIFKDVQEALQALGGRRELVSALVAGSQRLWDSWTDKTDLDCWTSAFETRSVEALASVGFPQSLKGAQVLGRLSVNALSANTKQRYVSLLEPDAFCALHLPPTFMREDDRRFFVCAAIRDQNRCRWSPELRRTFHHLTMVMTNMERVFDYRSLKEALKAERIQGVTEATHESYVLAYLQAIRHLRIVVPAQQERGRIRIAPDDVDPEFIVASLFGVSTGIAGLDQLFGGSGPILPEHCDTGTGDVPALANLMQSVCLPGRLILIRGSFGSGKSLLACHLAASVARKGGIANITSVEQEPTEYLYMLTSMGLIPNQPGFDIEFELPNPAKVEQQPSRRAGGALIYTRAQREHFEQGFLAMVGLASEMTAYPLRLLVIDSLNGLTDDSPERKKLHKAFRDLAAMGVNTIIIEEENESGETLTSEDENLADTVIRLSVANDQRYWKRRIQIKKCRFQREQRGEHHFSIASDRGINVVPSTAAVRTRIAQRRARSVEPSTSPSVCLLDSVVGLAPRPGHIVVIEGAPGTMKSALVEAALATTNSDTAARLFIGEPRRAEGRKYPADNGGRSVKFVPRGFSSPGVMFQLLDEIFLSWRRRAEISKLAIDDIAGLDLDAPLAASDPSIGHVLVDYLRRQDALSVIACRSPEPGEADGIRRAVIADADYHIQLVRISPGADGRVVLKVVKSPEMKHRRGWFDLIRTDAAVGLSDTPALVNVQDGEVRPLKVTLFLFADAAHQNAYNTSIVSLLRSKVNLDVHLASQEVISGANAFHLEGRSGNADIRIIQLDEFQLPDGTHNNPELHRFPAEPARERPRYLAHLLGRSSVPKLKARHAVPYYCNVGFLVCRDGLGGVVRLLRTLRGAHVGRDDRDQRLLHGLGETDAEMASRLDWRTLAILSDEFERHAERPELGATLKVAHFSDRERPCLFEHTGWMDENYAVLYLEILLWLRRQPPALPRPGLREKLEDWVLSDQAVDAARIFRSICRPGYKRNSSRRLVRAIQPDPNNANFSVEIRKVRKQALVWRQWFTTLGDLADALPEAAIPGTSVRRLPGGPECSIAGEWYLGVLADSALPDGGLELINSLVRPEAELDRLRRGIGLPTRRNFYEANSEDGSAPATWSRSRQLRFNVTRQELLELLEGSFRRSQFDGYVAKAASLSFALSSILDFEPDSSGQEPHDHIREILKECARRIGYMDQRRKGEPGDQDFDDRGRRDSVPPSGHGG